MPRLEAARGNVDPFIANVFLLRNPGGVGTSVGPEPPLGRCDELKVESSLPLSKDSSRCSVAQAHASP